MSKRNLTWMIGGMAAMFVLSFAISEFVPDAGAQQVLPGGKAAKIHSFYGTSPCTLTTSVPGDNGFLITDVVATQDSTSGSVIVRTGSPAQTVLWVTFGPSHTGSYHFESGVVLQSGTPLTVEGAPSVGVMISGYEF